MMSKFCRKRSVRARVGVRGRGGGRGVGLGVGVGAYLQEEQGLAHAVLVGADVELLE